jgi:hypothetical protein
MRFELRLIREAIHFLIKKITILETTLTLLHSTNQSDIYDLVKKKTTPMFTVVG